MRTIYITSIIVLIVITQACTMNKIKAPIAKKIEKELSKHDHTRIDNYYWLNDRENKEVISYLEDENAYTKAMMSDTEALQDTLFNELVGRIKKTDMSVPYFKNGYFYYTRYEEEKEYPIYCRKKESLSNAEEVLLNVNELAKDYSFYQVGTLVISPDNKMLAFSEDTLSRRIYKIRFKDLTTGEYLKDEITNTSGGLTWANDNKTLFYSVKDQQTLRSFQIYRYQLGNAESNTLVFEENDETFNAYVFKSRSKKYIIIGSSATLSDEYRVLDADNPTGEFKLFQPRERGLEYSIGHYKNEWFVVTNLNAKNFCLMKTGLDKTEKENWVEAIPYNENIFLEGFLLFDDYMVLHQREKGSQQLKVIRFSDKKEHVIDFGHSPYTAWFSINPEFNSQVLRVGFTSMTIPSTVYDYDMETRSLELLKQQEVVGGYNPGEYKGERIMVKAQDGIDIPVTLVYKNTTKLDGSSPLLMYGYGSYGHTIDPYFSSSRLSLLDRGFVYAIAHIRGSQVMGRSWYDDGKMLKKKNTFTDFIDCADYLVENKYGAKDKLLAMGGSAGGLLMGAIVNMRPDLFAGVIAAVPFVDVVTTMLDESIPLTTGEYDEWGNPNDEAYYKYILSYSPYDNVTQQKYPNMLVTTGLHDSQVQYWEPAKWVAKLREMKTDNNLLLLQTNMKTGHGGASGRFEPYKEVALEYAFLLKVVTDK